MLRRSQIPRGTKALVRKTGLEQVGRKRREAAEADGKPVKPALATLYVPAIPDEQRAALTQRSGGWCEMALPGCARIAIDPAHRISRKAGGRKGEAKRRHDQLSNVLHACRQCHTWSTSRPAESYELGLALREHQIPEQEPVVRRGELVYLDNAGGVHDFEAVGA